MSTEKELVFKACPMCAKNWPSQDSFLGDPELLFNGYQANFDIIEQGLFYFTHEKGGCGSTMILKAEMFFSLFTGTKYEKNQSLSEECPRYCHDRRKLNRCQVHCESAFVREICQIIEDRSLRN